MRVGGREACLVRLRAGGRGREGGLSGEAGVGR